MLVFKEVEQSLIDNGFKLTRKTRSNWSSESEWCITYENPLIKYGKFELGSLQDKDIITKDGVQYIKHFKFAYEINFDQSEKYISCYDWQRSTHEYFLFLLKWRAKKLKKQIDDFISHLSFLQERTKIEQVNEKLADVSKDFQ